MAMATEMAPAEEAVKAGGDTETIAIDKFSITSSKPDFLALPHTDRECDSVDSEYGLWVKCAVCDSIVNKKAIPPPPSNVIPCRAHRPFTLSRWTEHKAAEIHQQHLGCLKRSGLEELASSGTINRFEQGTLNKLQKKQKTIQFLPKAPGPLAQATNATVKDTCCDATNSIAPRTCEGIIIAYRGNTSLRKKLMRMFNIALFHHQQCMWLGKCYGMDCPKCLHIHVPPTKSHISSVLKYFSVQNAVIYCKLFMITTLNAFHV